MCDRNYTSYKAKSKRVNTKNDPDHRAAIAKTFRTTYAGLGLTLPDVAKLLRVSPRTLQNWNSGRYDIPYTAFKLLRVLLRYELPHDDWRGWHFSGGKLWTPEGYSIAAHESGWWSLMVLRARQVEPLAARCRDLELQLVDLAAANLGGRLADRPGAPLSGDRPQAGDRSAATVNRGLSNLKQSETPRPLRPLP
jgi:DNA-binding transcriptional regulator YiaG